MSSPVVDDGASPNRPVRPHSHICVGDQGGVAWNRGSLNLTPVLCWLLFLNQFYQGLVCVAFFVHQLDLFNDSSEGLYSRKLPQLGIAIELGVDGVSNSILNRTNAELF